MAYNQETVIEPIFVRFTNLSQDLQWKDYRNLFCQFGQINKLYIDPLGSFGKVQFSNIEHAYKAQKELDGKPPHKLAIEIGKPAASRLSSISDKTNLLKEKSSTMYRRQYNRYDENDDVDVVPSVHEYVDVYGRILDTLELEDGSEVYVPISDLRKSGFQIFPRGSLPKPGEKAFDEQLFRQHEMYLKTKSTEFMMVTQQSFPKERVNAVMKILQSEYRTIHYQGAVDNEARSRTITSPNYTPNRKQSRSPNRGRPSYERRNVDGQERRVHPTYSNNINSTDNWNDRTAKGGSSAATNNFQSQQSYGDAKTFDGHSNKGYNRAGLGKKSPQAEEPDYYPTPPRLQPVVKNTPQQQEEDGKNLVHAQKLPAANERSPQNPKVLFGESTRSPSPLRRPNSNPSEEEKKPEIKASSVKKIAQPTSSDSQTVQPSRKTVIEKEADSGYFDCTEIINEDTFVGVAMPATYVEEVCILDDITEDCKPDPTFKPNVGDTVAVSKDDVYVRGVVTSNLNGQYTCALIDYGVTISANKVCPLPDKYMNIPEFACLCKADSATLQEITKSSEHLMEIKAPSRIMVTIKDSGKVCEVIARRWDPFETFSLTTKKDKIVEELPIEEKQIVKGETIYKAPLKLYQLKPSDVVILVSEVEGSLIVRTRECDVTLKDIKQELNNYQGNPFTKQPEADQLVVCPFSDGALYRGIVLSVKSPNAVIKYVDYGNCDTIPIKELRTISEKLANLPSTAIKISLTGFVKSKFSSKALSYLEECAGRREKFSIVSGNNDQVYDLLFRDNSSLSEKLIALNKPPTLSNTEALPATAKAPSVPVTPSPAAVTPSPRAVTSSPRTVPPSPPAVTPPPRAVTPKTELPPASSPIILTDIPRCKLNVGDNEVMCLFAGDAAQGTASFCIADPGEIENKMLELSNRINAHIEKDPVSYHPKQFEVCLAKFEGEWYRAAFIKGFENSYGMFYLDYGNTKTVTAEDIRKMPKELAAIECLSALCILQGIKQDDQPIEEPLLSKITKTVTENEFYKIHVLKEENNCYVITIPLLFNEWKKEGLLS